MSPPSGWRGGAVTRPTLDPVEEDVGVVAGTVLLAGTLTVPVDPGGLVFYVPGTGGSRLSPPLRFVARRFNQSGLATLVLDLLTEQETADRAKAFDVELLGRRLAQAIEWYRSKPRLAGLPVAVAGVGRGAAMALIAAAALPATVRGVVSQGGRPDLAGDALGRVSAPTLLLVGALDDVILELNQEAVDRLAGPRRLVVIPGAGHGFEEPGKLEAMARLAGEWLIRCLVPKRPAS